MLCYCRYAFAYVSPAKQKQVLKKNGIEFFKHALKIEISKGNPNLLKLLSIENYKK